MFGTALIKYCGVERWHKLTGNTYFVAVSTRWSDGPIKEGPVAALNSKAGGRAGNAAAADPSFKKSSIREESLSTNFIC